MSIPGRNYPVYVAGPSYALPDSRRMNQMVTPRLATRMDPPQVGHMDSVLRAAGPLLVPANLTFRKETESR